MTTRQDAGVDRGAPADVAPTGAETMPVTAPRRGRHPLLRNRRARAGCAVAVVVALLAGSAALGGPAALAGSGAGLLLVAAFLFGGRVPVRLTDRVPAGVGFVVLLLNYTVRLLLVLVALVALRDASWLEPRAIGVTIVLGALLWSAVQVVGHVTSRRPTIEPTGSRR
jgi:ATP synthase protein I